MPDLPTSLAASGCELRSDALTRRLYASDASLYQVEPRAVAFPRSTAETAAIVAAAAAAALPVTPRGAGTGLAGGALGAGLVVDLARWGRWIDPVDQATATVRVGPGVVLDQLNAALRPRGLCFGPDVATSSRATIGGMVANNSSGAHAPLYGTTADHLAQLEVVLADGTVAVVGPEAGDLAELAAAADRVVAAVADEIARRLPPGLVKRWPGYGLDRYLRAGGDLSQLVAGSEGTLALVTAATLRLVPLPAERGLAVVFFASVSDALAAGVEIAALGPAAVELLDHQVLEPTRGNPRFRAARELLGLDHAPAAAVLIVEVIAEVDDYLAALVARRHGLRTLLCRERREQELVWSVRKAGLNLLTARLGAAKPAACIEDVCVRPERLPAYVDELARIMAELELEAAYYGHAASGELHIRPVLDLSTAAGVRDLRRVSDAVSELCRRFAGSLAAEHGVGIARSEYLATHLGPDLTAASGELKRLFDPAAVLNPGKIVDTGRYRVDRDLRQVAGEPIVLPFVPTLTVGDRHESFAANLEQCNGCGACRKDSPAMCPTFIATGDEAESTRGRANAVRAALAGGLGPDPLLAAELAAVLDDCLACKACRAECPSGVDLAAMKSQLLAARHARRGPSLFDRLVAAADLLGRLGTLAPGPANCALAWPPLRRALERWLGIAAARPLPAYAERRFDHWFATRPTSPPGERPRVLLWDDTWVRYHEPAVGVAAVAVLEALGLSVELVADRRCCGRPAFSRGLVDQAAAAGRHNLALLHADASDDPVVFLEPSCAAMFWDEYRALGLPHADDVARRAVLFEDLVLARLAAAPGRLAFAARGRRLAVHVHCHARALAEADSGRRLAACLPGAEVELLATGCCGMAGSFGIQAAKQELSRAVGAGLVAALAALPAGSEVVAAGTSCRHQLRFLTGVEPLHPAELLARDLAPGGS